MPTKLILLVAIIVVIWKFSSYSGSVTYGPGVKAPDEPVQQDIPSSDSFHYDDYTITPFAAFEITAKVLSRKNYSFGRESDLSPVDLALGWGRMSDESVLAEIEISQSGRFYRWQVQSFPIPRREIETHSANMHLIPANDRVKEQLSDVRQGDIVSISGHLVNVEATDDNWHWKSSKTRNDTGSGACELIWVESLNIKTL